MKPNPYEPPRAASSARPSAWATEQAEIFLKGLQDSHRPEHEYRVVDGAMFGHVSRPFYRKSQASFEELGFTFAADLEDVTMKSVSPDPRTFIRVMVDRNQTTVGAFYHICPRLIWRLGMLLLRIPGKIVDLESYTHDGHVFCTTTAPRSAQTPRPDSHHLDHAPRKLRIEEIYQRHLETLSQRKQGNSPVSVRTIDDVIDLQNLSNRQIYDHLERIGWVTKDYLRRQGLSAAMVDEVYDAARLLLENRRSTAGSSSAAGNDDQAPLV